MFFTIGPCTYFVDGYIYDWLNFLNWLNYTHETLLKACYDTDLANLFSVIEESNYQLTGR